MSAARWRFYRTANDRDIVREELLELGVEARAAVAEAMKRVARNNHFPHEQEHLDGDLCAVRVFLDLYRSKPISTMGCRAEEVRGV